jgi:uncharacterized protein
VPLRAARDPLDRLDRLPFLDELALPLQDPLHGLLPHHDRRHAPPRGGGALRVHVARRFGERRRGLAGLARVPPDRALLLPRCRAVHTLGMRVPLDLVWLGRDGAVVRVDRGVGPGRLRWCRGAGVVLECAAGCADGFVAAAPWPGYTSSC